MGAITRARADYSHTLPPRTGRCQPWPGGLSEALRTRRPSLFLPLQEIVSVRVFTVAFHFFSHRCECGVQGRLGWAGAGGSFVFNSQVSRSWNISRQWGAHFFPTSLPITPYWCLKVGHGRSMYNTEIGQCYRSGWFSQSALVSTWSTRLPLCEEPHLNPARMIRASALSPVRGQHETRDGLGSVCMLLHKRNRVVEVGVRAMVERGLDGHVDGLVFVPIAT